MTQTTLSDNELLELAESIARRAHDGQFRRDGATPYIVHPKAVVERAKGTGAKAVAWLHDVIEDTSWTGRRLVEAGIPEDLVSAVEILTKSSGLPYEQYLERVKANALAKEVKIADMLANLSDSPSRKQIIKYSKGLLYLHQD